MTVVKNTIDLVTTQKIGLEVTYDISRAALP